MENNELEKAQSSLDFENEELDIFKQDVAEKNIIKDFIPAEINENAQVVLEHRYPVSYTHLTLPTIYSV